MTDFRWADEWMRAWRSFPGVTGADPWTAAFDHFTKGNQAAYQRQFSEALAKVTEQSRAFFDLGQALVTKEGGGWQQAVFDYLDGLTSQLEEASGSARGLLGASTLDFWRQFAGHDAQPAPGTSQAPEGRGGGDPFFSRLDTLLRMPGVGYAREHQEALQELSRLWLGYERAYGEYAAYCTETARRSVDRLRERLTEEFGRGEGPATIRALYDTWVDASEETYAERVATEEYMHLHGAMINALMAYRRQAQALMDQWAQACNLPTREEVDALHRKLKDTREELRALKSRLGRMNAGGGSSRSPARPAGRKTTAARRKAGGKTVIK